MKKLPRRTVTELSCAYADAVLSSPQPLTAARRVIHDALERGVPPMRLYLDVLPEALHEVGRRWAEGSITPADEHLTTTVTQECMRRLASLMLTQSANGRSVLVAAVEGELHDMGARMAADVLEADGWQVFYTGASTPTDALIRMCMERRPDAVLLAATLDRHGAVLLDALRRLRRECPPGLYILVGGQACGRRDDLSRAGADSCETTPDGALLRLRERFGGPSRALAMADLSIRELDVLTLLGEGLTNREIAERLSLSLATVKTHVGHILEKMDVRNRAEAAAVAASARAGRAER